MNKEQDFINSYFEKIKNLVKVSKTDFIKYYQESKYGGYPEEAGGTVWDSEGKFIYVLIRILKPKNVLEIGNYLGKSANHILQAIENNGAGNVTLLDIAERIDYKTIHNNNFNRILADSLEYLKTPFDYDLIIQDGNHTYSHVKKEIGLILSNNQSKKFYVWAHDYFVNKTDCQVGVAWDEMKQNFAKFETFKDSVSNCGFCVAKK